MKIKNKYIYTAAVLIVSVIFYIVRAIPSQKSYAAEGSSIYYVERAVDGDTLKLSNGKRVRLIGVDTPEYHYSKKLLKDASRSKTDIKTIQALGKISSDFTKGLVEGKKVRLEFDVERYDRYGRILAYVYLEDGTFVNAEILKEGYGQVMTIPPNVKYYDYFLKLEREARSNNKGLWAPNRKSDTLWER